MEFGEKLQQLRKNKNLTQEELSEQLFVSRTAVSKWESGHGLPNIDSLKAISKLFAVSIDELLSGEELLQAAEEETKNNAASLRTILFGLCDVMAMLLLFIPLFGEKRGEVFVSVSLFNMQNEPQYMTVIYVIIISFTVVFGILEIVLQNVKQKLWQKSSAYISIIISILATILFILSQQVYIALLVLWILLLKGFLVIKQR